MKASCSSSASSAPTAGSPSVSTARPAAAMSTQRRSRSRRSRQRAAALSGEPGGGLAARQRRARCQHQLRRTRRRSAEHGEWSREPACRPGESDVHPVAAAGLLRPTGRRGAIAYAAGPSTRPPPPRDHPGDPRSWAPTSPRSPPPGPPRRAAHDLLTTRPAEGSQSAGTDTPCAAPPHGVSVPADWGRRAGAGHHRHAPGQGCEGLRHDDSPQGRRDARHVSQRTRRPHPVHGGRGPSRRRGRALPDGHQRPGRWSSARSRGRPGRASTSPVGCRSAG